MKSIAVICDHDPRTRRQMKETYPDTHRMNTWEEPLKAECRAFLDAVTNNKKNRSHRVKRA